MPMAAAQPSNSRGSVLSGYPSALTGIETFLDSFVSLLDVAIQEAITFARIDLRSAARTQVGWKDIADSLDVVYDGSSFSFVVTGEEAQATARTLEYGDGETPPSAFLRKTATAQARTLGTMVGSSLTRMVPSA